MGEDAPHIIDVFTIDLSEVLALVLRGPFGLLGQYVGHPPSN
jgi:hypothetical protein